MLLLITVVTGTLFGLKSLSGSYVLQAQEPAAASQLPPADVEITVDEQIASGLSLPVQVTHAGDGSNRLFVVEQDGRIKIIKAGTVLATPFLSIPELVKSPNDPGGDDSEQGLLSVAFDPNYENNGEFHVNYTRTGDGATVIARYAVSGDPDIAAAASAEIILTVSQFATNHNGGQLMFGPNDDYLYIGMGDGGGGGDPGDNGQDKETLLGAMLRISVTGVTTYTIPSDNPYVDEEGADEIWAIGLRNPWRFSFDRQNGDLYIGDVGQVAREEISYQAANTAGGLNFGWDCREGFIAYSGSQATECSDPDVQATFVEPIADYNRSEGTTVTGGFVYRGSLYPLLHDRYFYGDYGNGKIWSIYKTGANSWSTPELELDSAYNISSFGEDEQGELYLTDYFTGRVFRLGEINGPGTNFSTSTKTAARPYTNPGEVLTYTILLNNTGAFTDGLIYLVDTIPTGLGYVPASLNASHGTTDASSAPLLRWSGTATGTDIITITYLVTATGQISGVLTNQAVITGSFMNTITLTESVLVPQAQLYFPITFK